MLLQHIEKHMSWVNETGKCIKFYIFNGENINKVRTVKQTAVYYNISPHTAVCIMDGYTMHPYSNLRRACVAYDTDLYLISEIDAVQQQIKEISHLLYIKCWNVLPS